MSAPLLEVDRVTKTYAMGGILSRRHFDAVADVSFALEAGRPEIFTIIGESGSGKTTLARMMLNMVPPTTGRDHLRRHAARCDPLAARAAGLHAARPADLPEPVRGVQSA